MLQLLPGGRAHLEVIPAWAAGEWGMVQEQSMEACRARTDTIVSLLTLSLQNCCYNTSWITSEVQRQGRGSLLLSPPAMRLIIELQLLAAAAVQRQRQSLTEQQQQQQWNQVEQLKLLLSCNRLLVMQIRAAVFTQGGCLPPEVLQRAGLQLLQALAAPLQQLQLQLGPNRNVPGLSIPIQDGVINQQLYALQAAAAGPHMDLVTEGERAEDAENSHSWRRHWVDNGSNCLMYCVIPSLERHQGNDVEGRQKKVVCTPLLHAQPAS
jgi:hypothetical protein